MLIILSILGLPSKEGHRRAEWDGREEGTSRVAIQPADSSLGVVRTAAEKGQDMVKPLSYPHRLLQWNPCPLQTESKQNRPQPLSPPHSLDQTTTAEFKSVPMSPLSTYCILTTQHHWLTLLSKASAVRVHKHVKGCACLRARTLRPREVTQPPHPDSSLREYHRGWGCPFKKSLPGIVPMLLPSRQGCDPGVRGTQGQQGA